MLQLTATGNIGQDARVSEVNGSKSVNFSVAHNRKFVDKDGVMHESTEWINCTYWRRDGASIEVAKYLLAGTKVFVQGTPSVSTYQDKQNKTQVSFNLNVTTLELTGSSSAKEAPQQNNDETKKSEKKELEPASAVKKEKEPIL